MFDRFRDQLLTWLRVPPAPAAPAGAPGSARVFRAARNYYRLKLVGWGFGQIATLAGIAISLLFLAHFKSAADQIRHERLAAAAQAAANDNSAVQPPADENKSAERQNARAAPSHERFQLPFPFSRFFDIPTAFLHDPHNPFGHLIERSPWWLFPGIALLEFLGVAFYLIQLPVTYAFVRLEFESHWYIVTDRSLRIRWGLMTMREATMSFANIQQVTVSQGPLQRLLGLADVHVQSAGGGSKGDDDKGSARDSMHEGIFHGVDNATEIRDLILARLRQFRAAGLGDPDDASEPPLATPAAQSPASSDTLDAARTLLAEARALRQALH
jgi:Predicted membrane protein